MVRSLTGWAMASRILLVAYIVAILAMLAMALAISRADFPSPLVMAGLGIAALLSFALALAAAFAFLVWTWRAHANLPALGLAGLRYSPNWAVGSFFVPLLNLVTPFRAMRALYNRSMGEDAHLAHESAPDVTSWWACFIVGNAIQLFLAGLATIEELTPVYFTTPRIANLLLACFASALLAGSAFFLHRIIGAITRAQASSTGVTEAFA